jgi:hypothetical protein
MYSFFAQVLPSHINVKYDEATKTWSANGTKISPPKVNGDLQIIVYEGISYMLPNTNPEPPDCPQEELTSEMIEVSPENPPPPRPWSLHEETGLNYVIEGCKVVYFALDLPPEIVVKNDEDTGAWTANGTPISAPIVLNPDLHIIVHKETGYKLPPSLRKTKAVSSIDLKYDFSKNKWYVVLDGGSRCVPVEEPKSMDLAGLEFTETGESTNNYIFRFEEVNYRLSDIPEDHVKILEELISYSENNPGFFTVKVRGELVNLGLALKKTSDPIAMYKFFYGNLRYIGSDGKLLPPDQIKLVDFHCESPAAAAPAGGGSENKTRRTRRQHRQRRHRRHRRRRSLKLKLKLKN